ncbi:MAG: sensor histidine kinase [Armatimonadota bacterium]
MYKDIIENYKRTETRENQLWWLAILIILLMAIALYSINAINMPDEWVSSNQIAFALSTRVVRTGLILATLLICAYFRDNARRFRKINQELIFKLSENSEKLECKHNELARLKMVSDQLINIIDLPTALNLVLNTAVKSIGADKASIMLRDEDSDILRIKASYGFEQEVVDNTLIYVGEGIAGLVVESGQPIIINHNSISDVIASRITRDESLESSVIAPIHLSNEVRGVISIAKVKSKEPLTEENLSLLLALANQVSLVIQKVELHNDLMHKIDTLAITVTELKQTQAELVQAEKLNSIGRMAGGVAHEINNPLQTILGRTELLIEMETDEIKIHDMESIIEHTNRIADIVSNLLSFSRQSNNTKFRNLSINDVITKTIGLLEPQMNMDEVKVKCSLSDDLPEVFGRAGQLQQIFTNISLNSYQAMKEYPNGLLTITSRHKSDMVIVEFKDNGPGIPVDLIEHLFEPFFTTKPEGEGTGLGLSIAYGIAQAHRGAIGVDSVPGEGACFTVSLPAILEAPVYELAECNT